MKHKSDNKREKKAADPHPPETEETEDEITSVIHEEEVSPGEGENVSADLKEFETKLKEMENRYLRTYADFENFKKRIAKEREETIFFTSQRLFKEFLEVKDHLELALAHSEEASEVKGLREGVLLTLKQLVNFLEKSGVTEVNPLGQPFDPAFHEALGQAPCDSCPPGSVAQVYQKGYLLSGRLLRPARVIVASEKAGGSSS